MSADLLRRAASLMRERAEAVSYRSPWYPTRSGFVGADLSPESSIVDSVAEVFPSGGSSQQQSNAEHIASWHPAVALAVADWLDETVRLMDPEAECPDFDCEICSVIRRALAVVRAYLGESA